MENRRKFGKLLFVALLWCFVVFPVTSHAQDADNTAEPETERVQPVTDSKASDDSTPVESGETTLQTDEPQVDAENAIEEETPSEINQEQEVSDLEIESSDAGEAQVDDIDLGHTGLLFRLLVGPGFSYTIVDYENADGSSASVDSYAATAFFGFALGGFVEPNIAVHLTFDNYFGILPTLSGKNTGDTFPDDSVIYVQNYGIGFTYYFMPSNVYVSASLELSSLFVFDADESSTFIDDFGGLAGNLMVGREWEVSESWGVGLIGMVNASWIPKSMTNVGGMLLVSASYN